MTTFRTFRTRNSWRSCWCVCVRHCTKEGQPRPDCPVRCSALPLPPIHYCYYVDALALTFLVFSVMLWTLVFLKSEDSTVRKMKPMLNVLTRTWTGSWKCFLARNSGRSSAGSLNSSDWNGPVRSGLEVCHEGFLSVFRRSATPLLSVTSRPPSLTRRTLAVTSSANAKRHK